jgi:predicted Ser/Thr protein kinase
MRVLAPGGVVGGCRIEGVVGKGGMGVVYLARQLELERDVALKVISPELTEDPIARGRFLAEARAAAAVEHPNVVPVHAVGTEDELAYLVMRLIRGDDLRTLVRREGRLEPERAAAIAERIGDALDAIHRAGYVHRDVKPPNVLIDDDGHVYLSDFGLAKAALATRGPTSHDHWVGTLDYVAPEQIRGEPVESRTDVYALGGVLHFMLTGLPPFDRKGDEAKLWAHLHEPPPRPSELAGVPPGFDAVVARAMAKDPADRQVSAGELGRTARAVARGEDVAAPTATARRPRARGRRLTAWPLIAGLVAAAGAGAVAALALDDDPGPVSSTPAVPTATPTAAPQPAAPPGPRQPFEVVDELDRVGFRPEGLVVAGGGVWIVSHDRPKIVWMDLETRDRVPLEAIGRGATGIATDGEDVWITLESSRELVRFDARTRRLEDRFTVPGRPMHVAVGSAGLWVAMQEATREPAVLHRFARDGRESLDTVDVPGGVAALTAGGGAIWVGQETRGRILRVGPDGEVQEHAFFVDATPRALTYGRGRLWAVVGNDTAARVHPRTRDVDLTDTRSRPGRILVSGDRVLVSLYNINRVLVIDPRHWVSDRHPRLRVADNPMAMAAQGRYVFVTSGAESTLTVLKR